VQTTSETDRFFAAGERVEGVAVGDRLTGTRRGMDDVTFLLCGSLRLPAPSG
jgi:hypothetical protein